MIEVQIDGSLTEKVTEALRVAIVSGELESGRLYSANELAVVLGVSRTPVREALIQLASKGMVHFERNRGVRILQTTAHDLEEVFELRVLLEVPAARVAAASMTEEGLAQLERSLRRMHQAAEDGDEDSLVENDRVFHGLILKGAGNHRLVAIVDSLRDMVLTRGVSTAGNSRTLHDIAHEHDAILERLQARDGEGAGRAMRAHVTKTATLLLAQFGVGGSAIEPWVEGLRQ
jgi:DNA-binding GntR family transcriptional regulator